MFSQRSLKTFLIHNEMALYNIQNFQTFIQMAAYSNETPAILFADPSLNPTHDRMDLF